jgi:hypothetical protein
VFQQGQFVYENPDHGFKATLPVFALVWFFLHIGKLCGDHFHLVRTDLVCLE